MANSSIIGKAKSSIIKELIADKNILTAIGSSNLTLEEPQRYIGTHIFNYHQNPETIKEVKTFITVQVHIPRPYRNSDIFVSPIVEIWIVSHSKHMKFGERLGGIALNRNDYLGQIIDTKLNGRTDFGIGKLMLTKNVEGAVQNDYLYRTLIFECMDVNDSLCDK